MCFCAVSGRLGYFVWQFQKQKNRMAAKPKHKILGTFQIATFLWNTMDGQPAGKLAWVKIRPTWSSARPENVQTSEAERLGGTRIQHMRQLKKMDSSPKVRQTKTADSLTKVRLRRRLDFSSKICQAKRQIRLTASFSPRRVKGSLFRSKILVPKRKDSEP